MSPSGERLNTHSDFCKFCRKTCQHATWHAIIAADVYTRNHFSESMGSRLGGPGQMTLQTMSEFTFFVDFLPNLCSFDIAAKDL